MGNNEDPTWGHTVARAVLASVPYVGGAMEVIYADVQARRAARAARLVEDIVRGEAEEDFLRRLASGPRLEGLFVSAVNAAVATSIEAKRRLLAGAVRDAVSEPSTIAKGELIVTALGELDVSHVEALARLAEEWEAAKADDSAPFGWGTSEEWALLPMPIQAALVRTGAATPSPGAYWGSQEPQRAEGISVFGLELLAALRAEGWADSADGVDAGSESE